MTIKIIEYKKKKKYEASLKDLSDVKTAVPLGFGSTPEFAVADLFWKILRDPKWIPFIDVEDYLSVKSEYEGEDEN